MSARPADDYDGHLVFKGAMVGFAIEAFVALVILLAWWLA